MAAQTASAIRPPPTRFGSGAGKVAQASSLGFSHLKEPTGYGSVSLNAAINGSDIGKAWSRKTTYTDTEHAEDAVVDYIEWLEMGLEFPAIARDFSPTDLKIAQSLSHQKRLVITNLSASPCSSSTGTFKGGQKGCGCAERLIELAERGWSITIGADHYYQPQHMNPSDGKEASAQACEMMKKAGIGVVVAHK